MRKGANAFPTRGRADPWLPHSARLQAETSGVDGGVGGVPPLLGTGAGGTAAGGSQSSSPGWAIARGGGADEEQ